MIADILIFPPPFSIDIQCVKSFEKGDDGIPFLAALRSAPRIPAISHDREQTRNFSERRPARIHPQLILEGMDREVGPPLRLSALPLPISSFTSVLLPRYNEPKPRIFQSTGYTYHESSARALFDVLSAPREKHPVGDLIREYSLFFRKTNRFPAQCNCGEYRLATLASFISAILCI